MIGWLATLLLPRLGVRLARPAAWAIAIVAAVALLWGTKALYDGRVIQNYLTGANEDFLEQKDVVSGEADIESAGRKSEHQTRVKSTMELIDEAQENGCAIGEYLASDGAECVRDN